MEEREIGDLVIKFLEGGGTLVLIVWGIVLIWRLRHPPKKDIYLKER